MDNTLLIHTVPIKDKEYAALARLIYDKSGIALGDNKQKLMKTRLGKRLRALGLKSYSDYYCYLTETRDEAELMLMINAVTTNFTSFYRERQHFDFLLKVALPNIVQRKRTEGSTRIRFWCAASSTGEEPYTIALTLMEYFGDTISWDIKLLSTDISTKVLNQAVQGVYEYDKVKSVSPILLERYFERLADKEEKLFKVKSELKSLVTFRRLNLMDPVFPFQGRFDAILCRNVMIYFDQPTQIAVVEKLLKYLTPGGYLLIGHSENLPAVFRGRVEVLAPATYRKIK